MILRFQVNSPTINATELYKKDRVKKRIASILRVSAIVGIFVLLFVAIAFARKARTKWPFVTILLYTVFFVLILLAVVVGTFHMAR